MELFISGSQDLNDFDWVEITGTRFRGTMWMRLICVAYNNVWLIRHWRYTPISVTIIVACWQWTG